MDGPPGLGLEPQRDELRRERAGPAAEGGVHAGGIGVQEAALARLQQTLALDGGVPQADPAHEPIGIEGRLAEHLRQPALDRAPHELHLAEAVPGVEVSLREEGVGRV